jgi:hypothetical protein
MLILPFLILLSVFRIFKFLPDSHVSLSRVS